MDELGTVGAATIGGILPALAWLWFWLREDSKNPEPRRLIALAFFAGMVTVAVVIPIEKWFAAEIATGVFFPVAAGAVTTVTFIVWSIIEEVMKYLAALVTVLWRRDDDEPIDPVIYMVTVALGFAAVENALFLMSPLAGGTVLATVLTGNLRFIGATLLHVLSSSVIGLGLAFSFYKSRSMKIVYTVVAVILACALHATFNFFILNTAEEYLFRTFSFVWLGLIALIAILEFVKRIHR